MDLGTQSACGFRHMGDAAASPAKDMHAKSGRGKAKSTLVKTKSFFNIMLRAFFREKSKEFFYTYFPL